MTPLYPLKFEPIYKPKVWGGRTLERLGRALPGDGPIGESWEIADLDETSSGGGGGGAAHSRVRNGPLAGRTLRELLERMGEAVMGDVPLLENGRFPLLIKFLDARENLSVQVHPSEAYARHHPEAHLKSEAWYVLDAEPGARIYKGIREGVTPEQFRRAIETGEVEPLLVAVEARPGGCHYLPSGTCHALGAGLLVAEVQTPSDTTFRVYDWGRRGRQLHIEQALQCIHFGPVDTDRYEPGTRILRGWSEVRALVHCEHFRIERVRTSGPHEQCMPMNQQARVLMVLEGGGRFLCRDGPGEQTPFRRGETLLLPAAIDEVPLVLEAGTTTWLEVTFPQAGATRLA